MYYFEYGIKNNETIIFLHGANFIHSFGRQYKLQNQYHLVIPHIVGFGEEANRTFETEKALNELKNLIDKFSKKVIVVGFSLGAQLGFELIKRYPKNIKGAILVSPWLIKNESMLDDICEMNLKQLSSLKKKWLANLIGLMNGLPPKARKEFVIHMQNVKEETIINCVKNDISLDKKYVDNEIPVLAIAGSKENEDVINSIKQMAEINAMTSYEVWDKANHNIPPVYWKKFNQRIITFIESIGD